MIGFILSQYWKPIALAVLIAAGLAYRTVLIHQRDEARDQVAQLTAEATALRTSNQALGASIAQQNTAVTDSRRAPMRR